MHFTFREVSAFMRNQICAFGEETIRSIFLSNDISEYVIQELMNCKKGEKEMHQKETTGGSKPHSSIRSFREAMRQHRNAEKTQEQDSGIIVV